MAKRVFRKEDQTRARRIVLRLADFPSGWRAEHDGGKSSDKLDCLSPDFSDLTTTGGATSPWFFKGEAPFATSFSSFFETSDQARAAYDRLATEDLANCLAESIAKSEGTKVGDVSWGKLALPRLGDRSSAYQVAVRFEIGELTPSAYVDWVFIQRQRALAVMVFGDILTPFDEDLREDLVAKVAARMGLNSVSPATGTTVRKPPLGSRAHPYPFGRSVKLPNGWVVRIVKVTPNAWPEIRAANRFNDPPPDGWQFFMITLRATYRGPEEPARFDESEFKLVGRSNVAYATWHEPSCGVNPSPIAARDEVFHGGTITGNICWGVRKQDLNSLLMYHDEFLGEKTFFRLRR
ncbi:MAG: hypothetical protein C4306_12385 [Thermoleophilia bacterium]